MNFTHIINNIDATEIIDYMSQEKLAEVTKQDKKHMATGAGIAGTLGIIHGANAARDAIEHDLVIEPYMQNISEEAMPLFNQEIKKRLANPDVRAAVKKAGKFYRPLNAGIRGLAYGLGGAGLGYGISKLKDLGQRQERKQACELIDELYKEAASESNEPAPKKEGLLKSIGDKVKSILPKPTNHLKLGFGLALTNNNPYTPNYNTTTSLHKGKPVLTNQLNIIKKKPEPLNWAPQVYYDASSKNACEFIDELYKEAFYKEKEWDKNMDWYKDPDDYKKSPLTHKEDTELQQRATNIADKKMKGYQFNDEDPEYKKKMHGATKKGLIKGITRGLSIPVAGGLLAAATGKKGLRKNIASHPKLMAATAAAGAVAAPLFSVLGVKKERRDMNKSYMETDKNTRWNQFHHDAYDKMEEKLLKSKTACESIDLLYKEAKITVPSKEEAKKETKPTESDNDLPEIDCENCDYVGPTEATGECPVCGAIMGIKPKQQNIPSSPFTLELLEPRSGISMQDAEMIGRMEESSFSAW